MGVGTDRRRLDIDTTLVPAGLGRFGATVLGRRFVRVGPNGGYVAALLAWRGSDTMFAQARPLAVVVPGDVRAGEGITGGPVVGGPVEGA